LRENEDQYGEANTWDISPLNGRIGPHADKEAEVSTFGALIDPKAGK
jgi:hypothetical protein